MPAAGREWEHAGHLGTLDDGGQEKRKLCLSWEAHGKNATRTCGDMHISHPRAEKRKEGGGIPSLRGYIRVRAFGLCRHRERRHPCRGCDESGTAVCASFGIGAFCLGFCCLTFGERVLSGEREARRGKEAKGIDVLFCRKKTMRQ